LIIGSFIGAGVCCGISLGGQMQRLLIAKRLFILRHIAFLGCITSLPALAWLPANTMARTALGGQAEHLIAYLGTTIVMGMAYPTNPRLAAHSVLLIGYAAILEVGQLGVSGRHASFDDFAFSAAGVAIGGLFLWIVRARPWARPIARERA
jgi:VanZ family protein